MALETTQLRAGAERADADLPPPPAEPQLVGAWIAPTAEGLSGGVVLSLP